MRWKLKLALLLTLSSAQAVFAAEQWLKIKSSNFELFTTAGEKKGRETILYFEQVRSLFGKLTNPGQSRNSRFASSRSAQIRNTRHIALMTSLQPTIWEAKSAITSS